MDRPKVDQLFPISEMAWTPSPEIAGQAFLNLASDFDEERKTGSRTRLVRFAPGTETKLELVHDYFEEVLLVSGDLGGVREAVAFGPFSEQAYVLRPPGTPHGPFRSEGGCVMMEFQYYKP